MKSVVITGAGGFIGKALAAEFLNNEYEVFAVVKSEDEIAFLPKHINLHAVVCNFSNYGNLSEYISKNNIEYFVHLAWAGVAGAESRQVITQIDNIKAACLALEQAAKLQTKHFLFAGSSYQYRMEAFIQAGEEKFAKKNIYGLAKQAAVDLLRALSIEYNIVFNAVLFTNVFGVGDCSRRSTNVFIKQLLSGENLNLISGEHKHDWTYIDDAVQGILSILTKGQNGKSYYVGKRNLFSFKEIITRVRDILSPEAELNFGFYDDKGYIDYSEIDLDELYRDTGFECQADFKESILKTAEWLKEQMDKRKEDIMEKIIVVGSGFSGSILARKIAEELNRKVLVVEKRPHIGGNMYDEYDEKGILIQRYGPHFLNTNKYYIIKFLQQYGELFPHNTKLLSYIDGKYARLPFNFTTVQQLVGAERAEPLLAKMRYYFYGRDRVPVLDLVEHEDKDISAYGTLLFEKSYRTYTSKMWGIEPEQIDKSVLDRVPMAMSYDERYLNKDFQYLPVDGFTRLFKNMLAHPNIKVELNVDALAHLHMYEQTGQVTYDGQSVECLIYTGAIDELFGLKYGALPYRSLDIRYEYSENDSILPSEIISYPQAMEYTRSTEYRKIMYDDSEVQGSVVATEYPLEYDPRTDVGNTPYYPVLTESSQQVYQKYLTEAAKYKNLFLCGRLAEFKYYNMDVCIEHALAYFANVKAWLEQTK